MVPRPVEMEFILRAGFPAPYRTGPPATETGVSYGE
jgi:hypothetical protein